MGPGERDKNFQPGGRFVNIFGSRASNGVHGAEGPNGLLQVVSFAVRNGKTCFLGGRPGFGRREGEKGGGLSMCGGGGRSHKIIRGWGARILCCGKKKRERASRVGEKNHIPPT